MDFPTAWAISRSVPPGEHAPRCATAQSDGAVLCDCSVLTSSGEYLAEHGQQVLIRGLSVTMHIPARGIALIVDALACYGAAQAQRQQAGEVARLRERLHAGGSPVDLTGPEIDLISDSLGHHIAVRSAGAVQGG